MKIRCDAEVVVEGGLRVFPNAEEMNLAADLLAPLAVVVRGQGKRGGGLGGLVSAPACRLADEHDGAPYDDQDLRAS